MWSPALQAGTCADGIARWELRKGKVKSISRALAVVAEAPVLLLEKSNFSSSL